MQMSLPGIPPPTKAERAWARWRKAQAGRERIRRMLEARRRLQDERQGTQRR